MPLAIACCSTAWKRARVSRSPGARLPGKTNSYPGVAFGIFETSCNYMTTPQLREWRIFVVAGALDIQDRVAGGATPLAGQFGAESARRAEFNIIGEQLFVRRVRAALDDDIIRLQLES